MLQFGSLGIMPEALIFFSYCNILIFMSLSYLSDNFSDLRAFNLENVIACLVLVFFELKKRQNQIFKQSLSPIPLTFVNIAEYLYFSSEF